MWGTLNRRRQTRCRKPLIPFHLGVGVTSHGFPEESDGRDGGATSGVDGPPCALLHVLSGSKAGAEPGLADASPLRKTAKICGVLPHTRFLMRVAATGRTR